MQKSSKSISFLSTLSPPYVPASYELKAVISHYGSSINTGHYKAFISREFEWLEYDDDHVKSVCFERVVRDSHAFTLLYHRINDIPLIHPVHPPNFAPPTDDTEPLNDFDMQTSDPDDESNASNQDQDIQKLTEMVNSEEALSQPESDSNASGRDQDIEQLTEMVNNDEALSVKGCEDCKTYKDAYEAVTLGFAQYDLYVAGVYNPLLEDLKAKSLQDPKVEAELEWIEDQQEHFDSAINNTMTRLREVMPEYMVGHWVSLFDSVSRKAKEKKAVGQVESGTEVGLGVVCNWRQKRRWPRRLKYLHGIAIWRRRRISTGQLK